MLDLLWRRLSENFAEIFARTGDKVLALVPRILFAALVLVLGCIAAHLVRKAVLRLFDVIGLDKLAAKVSLDRALRVVGLRGNLSAVLGVLVYGLLLLLAVLLASELLELQAVADAIGAIVAYIPHLIGGLLILTIGLLLGRFFRDVVSTSLARANVAWSALLGVLVQGVIVIFVCILALRQVGFDVSVITTNLSVILGVLLVSVGLAVALAVRPVLENSFICRELRQNLRIGDDVRSGEVQGRVVGFSLTSVIVRQGEEDVIIPARRLFEQGFSRKRIPPSA